MVLRVHPISIMVSSHMITTLERGKGRKHDLLWWVFLQPFTWESTPHAPFNPGTCAGKSQCKAARQGILSAFVMSSATTPGYPSSHSCFLGVSQYLIPYSMFGSQSNYVISIHSATSGRKSKGKQFYSEDNYYPLHQNMVRIQEWL